MTSKQLESRVRRIIQEAGKRKIYKKAHELAIKFAEEFGSQKIEVRSDHTNTDRRVNIYTGNGQVSIWMWNSHWGPMNIEIRLDCIPVFRAHSASRFDVKDAKAKGREWQYAQQGLDDYARVELYKPGQWERVLEVHEAERLLKAERDAKTSLEEKKKKEAERNKPLTEEEKKLAANFGIRVQ